MKKNRNKKLFTKRRKYIVYLAGDKYFPLKDTDYLTARCFSGLAKILRNPKAQ